MKNILAFTIFQTALISFSQNCRFVYKDSVLTGIYCLASDNPIYRTIEVDTLFIYDNLDSIEIVNKPNKIKYCFIKKESGEKIKLNIENGKIYLKDLPTGYSYLKYYRKSKKMNFYKAK